MPRELITIQIGQCGNQIGAEFWDLALHEHAKHAKRGLFDESMSSFFRNVDPQFEEPAEIPVGDGKEPIKALRARAVCVDMEEGVISGLANRPMLGELFDHRQFITDVSGSGNNWAHGHMYYGPQYRDAIAESVRRTAEFCDSLQSFFLIHSLGGGTGSGLGTYILKMLEDDFSDVYRFTTAVFPSQDDDVITSPYNSVLAINELREHADCVLPIENQSLIDLVKRMTIHPSEGRGKKVHGTTGTYPRGRLMQPKNGTALSDNPSMALQGKGHRAARAVKKRIHGRDQGRSAEMQKTAMLKKKAPSMSKDTPFAGMNRIAAHLLTHLTSGMRFEGSLNVDLNEITTNLVPYPKLHFLCSSLAPLYSLNDVAMPVTRVDQMFSDAFHRNFQLLKVDPQHSTYLACGLLVRGGVQISDMNRNIERVKRGLNLKMIYWNEEGFKIGLCKEPSLNLPHSLLCLANNCCINTTFENVLKRFHKLYSRKAHVHHYTEFMDLETMTAAAEGTASLADEYRMLDSAEPPEYGDARGESMATRLTPDDFALQAHEGWECRPNMW